MVFLVFAFDFAHKTDLEIKENAKEQTITNGHNEENERSLRIIFQNWINIIVVRFHFLRILTLMKRRSWTRKFSCRYILILFVFLHFFFLLNSFQWTNITTTGVLNQMVKSHERIRPRKKKVFELHYEKKITYLKSRKCCCCCCESMTQLRACVDVRDYKSNENTIYSKRSKSVWLVKTRRWEREKERERNSHIKLSRSIFSLVLRHCRICIFIQ